MKRIVPAQFKAFQHLIGFQFTFTNLSQLTERFFVGGLDSTAREYTFPPNQVKEKNVCFAFAPTSIAPSKGVGTVCFYLLVGSNDFDCSPYQKEMVIYFFDAVEKMKQHLNDELNCSITFAIKSSNNVQVENITVEK